MSRLQRLFPFCCLSTYLLLQQSEMMSEEEKLVAQEHLKPFTHLIKDDPYDTMESL
ncbi:MAG: hypothetical protein M3Z24_02220 [Chloroflexota bacterium]|nr:hypothetical protein [Chloroflexota bacterium]